MVLDLNRLPYFNDYDENKNYHQILFKPGVAVQARELTQLQNILQNQIERFGKHVFQEGTIVLGGTFEPQDPIDYVRVSISNSSIIEQFINKDIQGSVTGLKANVIHAEADDIEANVAILFIRYTNSSTTATTFQSSETITSSLDNVTVITTDPTGTGSIFGISDGVLFSNGYFIHFEKQRVSLNKYSPLSNKKVYFRTEFTTVDYNEDQSLLDNAQGFNNFNAPGADRLRANLRLVVSDVDVDLSDDNTSLLIEVDEGRIKQKNERTLYGRIYDEVAKRTHDESGDYMVRGWNVYSRENLDTGSNGGLLSAEEGGDANTLSIGIESGLAYVKGYEIQTYGTTYVNTPKSTAFENINNQFAFVQSGAYTEVEEIRGLPDPDSNVKVNLYDTAENRITNKLSYLEAPTGNKIGEARISSYLPESGQLGQSDATLRLYINDIKMQSNFAFSDVKSMQNSNFFADVVLVDGRAELEDTQGSSRLIPVGSSFIRDLKNEDGNSDTSIEFNRSSTQSFGTNGQGTFSVSITNESLPYGTGTLQSLAKETLLLTIDDETEVTLSGDLEVQSGNTTVTGNGTFFTYLNEGDRLKIDGSVYNIDTIANNTVLELEEASTTTGTFGAVKIYLQGDLIDLSSKGADTGNERIVNATTSSISIDLQETLDTSAELKLTHRVVRSSVQEIPKVLKPSRYVIIDGSNTSSLDTFSLGFSDVYRIRQVRKSSNTFSTSTDGVDVTSSFVLNNGQTLNSYETSFITTNSPIANTEYLLVELDYFDPDFSSGLGYFSIDSYPIDDEIESDTTIKTVDIPVYRDPLLGTFSLRDFVDTRFVKTNTASDATTVGTASVNPEYSTTYETPTNGLRSPVPGTNLVFDYSFYLPRRDVLGVDREGNFVVLQGEPSSSPGFPRLSETYMQIALIEVPPFPSISETLGRILDKKNEAVITEKTTISRSTMRDVDTLRKRVQNLEYYNALNILEQQTVNLEIPDENGLDRFKNGIFVDPFIDHSLAQNNSDDYNISVDKNTKEIRPFFRVDGFNSVYSEGENVSKTGDLIHLSYEENILLDQPYATTIRNIELSSYRYIGDLEISPSIDTWSDTETVDKTVLTGVDLPPGKTITTDWGSWQRHSTGAVSGSFRPSGGAALFKRNAGEFAVQTRDGDVLTDRGTLGNTRTTSSKEFRDTFRTSADAQAAAEAANLRRFWVVTGGTETEQVHFRREGVETTIVVDEELDDVGSFVTDVSVIPYIRPQTIRLYAQGLKPNTRFYIFFDDENMTQYTAPAEIVGEDLTNLNNLQEEGSEIFSDDQGDVLAFLNLPEDGKRFRVGTKELVITDNPTNSSDLATSYATAEFYSSGLSLQKQNTILSTRTIADENERKVTQTRTETRTVRRQQRAERFGPSCLAYSFYVDEPEESEGVYLTSIDIFIESLHPELGVWFEIREMSNDGGITQNMLPFSKVWMKRDDPRLKISSDGISNPTNVDFESPVFLYNKTQYAFIIHTEALNPDTYFWVSELGGTDVASGNPVTGRQLTGTTFTTNNNLNWDIVPDVDLKCKFYRAEFDTSSTGVATFVNEDLEFLQSNTSLPSTFFNVGEPVKGSDILEISLDGANTVVVGDVIRDSNLGAEAEVVSIDGTEIFTNDHGFLVGANVDIYDSANNAKETGQITTVDFGTGVIRSSDREENRFIIEKSNGRFFEGSNIRSVLPNRHITVPNPPTGGLSYSGITESNASNPYFSGSTITLPNGLAPGTSGDYPEYNVEGFYRYGYTATHFRPGFVNHENNATITFSYRGLDSLANTSTFAIKPYSDYEFDSVYDILSRSEEVSLLDGDKSVEIKANLISDNNRLSPSLDSSLMGGVYILNRLNDDISEENLASGGSLESTYLSKVIDLDEQNEAEDIIAFLSEYRPATTDVQVWVRIKSKYDSENILDKEWFLLSSSKSAISSDINKSDFIDVQYTAPDDLKTGPFGEIEYVSGDGNTYTGYSQFQIKIGMIGSNPAIYPKAAHLRAIALQV